MNPEDEPSHAVAVIGAGVAGLAAARALRGRGRSVVVFDKGRRAGGRVSSRDAGPFAFDHGAQYFTARGAGFRRQVQRWCEEGVAAPWSGRIGVLRAGAVRDARGSAERFVGVPRMRALAEDLARGVEVRQSVQVARLERRRETWHLFDADGDPLGAFGELYVTAPPAQAAALVGDASPLGARAGALVLQPCWAVLLGFAERYAVALDGAFCEDSALSWIARDSSKPGRPAGESWVLHASPGWTEAHWDEPREQVVSRLAAELERVTGVRPPPVLHRDAHRWRYAQPDPGLDVGCLVDGELGLALAGDAYVGGRVEGAFSSGIAAVERLCDG